MKRWNSSWTLGLAPCLGCFSFMKAPSILTTNQRLTFPTSESYCSRPANILCIIILLGLITIIGCSKKIEVTGQVSLDDQPLTEGMIDFRSERMATVPPLAISLPRDITVWKCCRARSLFGSRGSRRWALKKLQLGSQSRDMPIKEPMVPKKYNAQSKLEVDVDHSHRTYDFPLEGDGKAAVR